MDAIDPNVYQIGFTHALANDNQDDPPRNLPPNASAGWRLREVFVEPPHRLSVPRLVLLWVRPVWCMYCGRALERMSEHDAVSLGFTGYTCPDHPGHYYT